MVLQASFYTAVLQNSLIYEFMQCNQQYSNTFGIEELPVCLNSGFCVDLGKFHGIMSQPSCLCSDDFFGSNCQYRVNPPKTSRVIRAEIDFTENDIIDDKRMLVAKTNEEIELEEVKFVEPELVGQKTMKAMNNEQVPRNGRMRRSLKRVKVLKSVDEIEKDVSEFNFTIWFILFMICLVLIATRGGYLVVQKLFKINQN